MTDRQRLLWECPHCRQLRSHIDCQAVCTGTRGTPHPEMRMERKPFIETDCELKEILHNTVSALILREMSP